MSNPFEGYRVTSPFGWRNNPFGVGKEFHTGIDLVKSHKAPIYAFTSGEVLHAKMGATGTGFGNYGNVVAIKDSKGHLHVYAHLDSCTVKVGSKVKKGQLIGYQGSTGRVTGSHLHYEIRKKCSPSFGWIADRANNCYEPTQYLMDFNVSKPKNPIQNKITGNTYKVKAGDTLGSISIRAKVSMDNLAKWNNIKNPNKISVGQILKLKAPTKTNTKKYHTVEKGDVVSKLANKYGSTIAQIKAWNKLDSKYTIYVGQKLRVK